MAQTALSRVSLRCSAQFLWFFPNPLVLILLIASGVSLALGEHVGGLIIIAIVLLSVMVNFFMEFQARHAVEDIQKQVAMTAAVLRDGHEQELPIAELVPGDIVRLNAGDLVPADARLLEAKDLHVRESALTGESLPVEKAAADLPSGQHSIADASNSVFLGTAVQTGIGTAVIVRTGKDTAFGEIAQRLAMRPPETEFGRGIRHFGLMITRVIMLLVLFVLLVNIIFHRPLLESFLFSVALAVGMTPEMMPMIITDHAGAGRAADGQEEGSGQATFGDRGLRQHRDSLQRQDGHADRRRDRAGPARGCSRARTTKTSCGSST